MNIFLKILNWFDKIWRYIYRVLVVRVGFAMVMGRFLNGPIFVSDQFQLTGLFIIIGS